MRWITKSLWLSCLTVVLIIVMVNLSLWQRQRGEDKQALEQALLQRQQAEPINYWHWFATWQQQPQLSQLGVKVELTIMPYTQVLDGQSKTMIILLDNQTWQGKVGYLAYQVMQVLLPETDVPSQETLLLLELGFVAAGPQREVLPNVSDVNDSISVVGRWYQRQSNWLSDELMAEAGMPLRIQNLALSELATYTQLPLLPYVLQPLNTAASPSQLPDYPHPWQPVAMASSRHFAYAWQWLVMALVLAGLFSGVVYRSW